MKSEKKLNKKKEKKKNTEENQNLYFFPASMLDTWLCTFFRSFVDLSACRSVSVCLSVCLSVRLFGCLSVYLCPTVRLSVIMPVGPSVRLASCLPSYSPLVKAKEGPNDMLKVKLLRESD